MKNSNKLSILVILIVMGSLLSKAYLTQIGVRVYLKGQNVPSEVITAVPHKDSKETAKEGTIKFNSNGIFLFKDNTIYSLNSNNIFSIDLFEKYDINFQHVFVLNSFNEFIKKLRKPNEVIGNSINCDNIEMNHINTCLYQHKNQ